MKKLLQNLSLVIFIGILVGLSSCKKSSTVIPLPSMKATIDGAAWVSIFRLSVLNQTQTPANIVITGTPTISQTADKTLILTIKGIDAGTYNLNAGTLSAQCLIVYKKTSTAVENSSDYFTSTQATISISKIDKTNKQLSGTFSATLFAVGVPNAVVITNGTFDNLNYQLN